MNPDGSGVVQLTNNTADDRLPAWSPDGTKIAFVSNRDGDYDVWVMNADGSGQTQLTLNAATEFKPDWSPDGTKIAFASDLDGDGEIYVMNADGSGQTQLTFNSTSDYNPVWSPDGSKLAFQRGDGSAAEIYVMNADGSGQTQLTSNGVQDVAPRWSPDGSKILFRRDLGNGSGWGELFTMNPDGTGETNLTNTASIYEGEGAYSPDGTKIVLDSNQDDSNFDIYVMNADGSGRVRITNSSGFDGDLDWQRSICVQPPTGLVSWWPGDGNATDKQGVNAGSLQNGATFAAGKVGQAFALDGVNDKVSVSSITGIETQQFTVDAWVLAHSAGSEHDAIGGVVVTKDIGDTYTLPYTSWTLTGPGTGGRFHAFVGLTDNTHQQLTSTNTFAFDQFHHVAMSWDGSTLSLYVDGGIEGTLALGPKTISYSGEALSIGNHNVNPAAHRALDGVIDEVEFFNRALSASEVFAIYNAGAAGKCKCVQPPSGLVGWWPGDGNANDFMGNFPGTALGGATFAPGWVGQSFNFDGNNGRVEIADAPFLRFGTGDLTVDAWIKSPAGSVYRAILGKELATYPYSSILFRLGPNGKLQFAVTDCGTSACGFSTPGGGGSRQPVESPSRLDNGVFHHVAGVRTASGYALYVDGQLVSTRSEPARDSDNNASLFIGMQGTGGPGGIEMPFAGLVDEVEVFNRALSGSEIAAIYDASVAGKCKDGYPVIGVPPVTPRRGAMSLGPIGPNPAEASALISFTLSGDTAATLELYDTAGRLIARHAISEHGVGPHTFLLTGLSRLRNGIYLIRLSQGGVVRTGRLAVIQ